MSNLDTKKLISIAKRISGSSFDNLAPQTIYTKLTSEFPYNDITSHLKPLDVIVLTFIIPFIGKDVPSKSSEFAHPDIIIGLTILAYRYSGLRKDDYIDIIDSITSQFVREIGPSGTRR